MQHERDIVRFLVADASNGGSVVSSVASARENLRTTREVLPREAWQAVNDLYLFTSRDAEGGVDRRSRARYLGRVISDCQRLDGVLSGMMSRDQAYELWRLGQMVERADMTTRVLGVRAASLLSARGFVQLGAMLVRRSPRTDAVWFEPGREVVEDIRYTVSLAMAGARFVSSESEELGLLYRQHPGVRYSTRPIASFARGCAENAIWAQEYWEQHGGLTPPRRAATPSAAGRYIG